MPLARPAHLLDGDSPCPSRPAPSDGRRIEVGQGQCAIADRPGDVMTAVLGSCVAFCLWAPRHGIGGMNHVYRAVTPGPLGAAEVVAEGERLVNMLMQAGLRRRDLQAWLVGGAHLLARGRDNGKAIGIALNDYIFFEGIPLRGTDLGGVLARRVTFRPDEGRIDVVEIGDVTDATPRGRPGNAPELF